MIGEKNIVLSVFNRYLFTVMKGLIPRLFVVQCRLSKTTLIFEAGLTSTDAETVVFAKQPFYILPLIGTVVSGSCTTTAPPSARARTPPSNALFFPSLIGRPFLVAFGSLQVTDRRRTL